MPDPDRLRDPSEHLADLWRSLADALHGDSPLRSPSLGTVGLDGSPRSRTVVLRDVDPDARTLTFHADARSEKIAELRRDPRVAWCFWDEQTQTQLRVASVATTHVGDALTRSLWPKVPAKGRPNYASIATPGTFVDDPFVARGSVNDGGEANFAVIVARATRFDWLWLRREGHVRCIFTLEGEPTRAWVAP